MGLIRAPFRQTIRGNDAAAGGALAHTPRMGDCLTRRTTDEASFLPFSHSICLECWRRAQRGSYSEDLPTPPRHQLLAGCDLRLARRSGLIGFQYGCALARIRVSLIDQKTLCALQVNPRQIVRDSAEKCSPMLESANIAGTSSS